MLTCTQIAPEETTKIQKIKKEQKRDFQHVFGITNTNLTLFS